MQVQSLVGQLRSHKPHSVAKRQKPKTKKTKTSTFGTMATRNWRSWMQELLWGKPICCILQHAPYCPQPGDMHLVLCSYYTSSARKLLDEALSGVNIGQNILETANIYNLRLPPSLSSRLCHPCFFIGCNSCWRIDTVALLRVKKRKYKSGKLMTDMLSLAPSLSSSLLASTGHVLISYSTAGQ